MRTSKRSPARTRLEKAMNSPSGEKRGDCSTA